jgi:hypothetical protein
MCPQQPSLQAMQCGICPGARPRLVEQFSVTVFALVMPTMSAWLS